MNRGEIDRIGAEIRQGRRDDELLRHVDAVYALYEPAALAVSEKLADFVRWVFSRNVSVYLDAGGDPSLYPLLTGGSPTMSQRPTKTLDSIAAKLERQSTMHLSQMQDIVGCRFVVADRSQQDALLHLLGAHRNVESDDAPALFERMKVHDRRAAPSSGYRAVHVIVTHDDIPYEIQLRTSLQNRWAQLSENADDLFPGVKYGAGPTAIQERLVELSDRTDRYEREWVRVVQLEPPVEATGLEQVLEWVNRTQVPAIAQVGDEGEEIERLYTAFETFLRAQQ